MSQPLLTKNNVINCKLSSRQKHEKCLVYSADSTSQIWSRNLGSEEEKEVKRLDLETNKQKKAEAAGRLQKEKKE